MLSNQKHSVEYYQRRIKSLAKLSTLPHLAAKVMELVENPKTSASTLGRIISMDQVLAARILKLANSAYYGFPRKISTINLAIVILGFNTLRDMVLSISVVEQFKARDNSVINLEQFWRHALIVGMGSRLISRFAGYPVIGEVFVAGLLHDIGYLVLMQHFPDTFESILTHSRENDCSFTESEMAILGFTHADIGAWLAEGWNLPEKLVKAIRNHHEPPEKINRSSIAWMIHCADAISYSIGEGNSLVTGMEFSDNELEEKIKLISRSNYSLGFMQEKFREEGEKINDFLEVLTNKTTIETMV